MVAAGGLFRRVAQQGRTQLSGRPVSRLAVLVRRVLQLVQTAVVMERLRVLVPLANLLEEGVGGGLVIILLVEHIARLVRLLHRLLNNHVLVFLGLLRSLL